MENHIMANTTKITFVGSKHELLIKQLVPKTVGNRNLHLEQLESREEILLFPNEKLSNIALVYMSRFPETHFFSISLHKIEIYQDSNGKTYYTDTVVEELDAHALASLRK